MPLTADQEKRVNILFAEVEDAVKNGRTALVGRHDTARRVARFLDTQKRAIGMNLTTFVLTASIAILGGPIAAAVGLGAAIVGFGLSTAWERLSVSWAKGKYLEKKKKKGITVMDEHGVMREEYREVLSDVTTVLKKQGLTDVYNAFANMDVDFQHLSKFVADPHITGQWSLPSAEAGHKFGPTRGTPTATDPLPTITINSCNDAVELWETVKRVSMRYGQVAEVLAMLDEFIMHVSLAVSRYDATERQDLRLTWGMVSSGRTAPEIYDLFNASIRTEAIQKYVGRHVRTKDYSGWVYSIIPDYIKDSWSPGLRLDMQLEMLHRNDKDAFTRAKTAVLDSMRTLGQRGAAARPATASASAIAEEAASSSMEPGRLRSGATLLGNATKEYVGSVVPIPDDISVDEMGGFVKSVSLAMGSNFLSTWLNSMQSESWQYAHTAASVTDSNTLASLSSSSDAQQTGLGYLDPLNPTKLMRSHATSDAAYQAQVASHIMGVASAVVKVAIEAVNDWWNERKLKTGQTLGFSGMRQQSFGERIGTLRTFAKGEIDAYVELMDDWNKAHDKLSGSLDDRTAPGAFLMHLKASQSFYGNHTGQFFEELVFMANEMKTRLERLVKGAEDSIKTLVGKPDMTHFSACKGKQFCFAGAGDVFLDWMVTDAGVFHVPAEMSELKRQMAHVPSRSLTSNAMDDLKEYFEFTIERLRTPGSFL